jgi:uncharacterized membrane protein YbhN (UPF0104 family)
MTDPEPDAANAAATDAPARRRRPSIAQLIQIVFTVAVVIVIGYFLYNALHDHWNELQNLQLAWIPFVISVIIGLLYRYWGTVIWLFLLERLGGRSIRHNFVELSYVYAKAWLGRYLLGAGTWILGKVYFASRFGISKNKLAVSGVLEGILQLISTLIVGLGLLLVDPRLGTITRTPSLGWVQTTSIIALILSVIALIPPVFRFGMGLLYRIVRRKKIPIEDLPDWKAILGGAGFYIVATLITGTSYFFITQAVFAPLKWTDFLYVIGTSSIAAAISLLAVFAPGGIGVREGAQIAFFSVLMPVPVATVVAIVMRLWSLAVDVLFFLIAALIKRIANRRQTR